MGVSMIEGDCQCIGGVFLGLFFQFQQMFDYFCYLYFFGVVVFYYCLFDLVGGIFEYWYVVLYYGGECGVMGLFEFQCGIWIVGYEYFFDVYFFGLVGVYYFMEIGENGVQLGCYFGVVGIDGIECQYLVVVIDLFNDVVICVVGVWIDV